jgi:type I restriction enzyme, S subunit
MILKNICVVDWGNTELTKSSYVENGRFLAVSAAGCDGKIDHYEHESDVSVLSAIGSQCGKMFFPNTKFTAIKNTITLKPKENVLGKYIFYLFTSINLPKRGTGQPFISKGDIEKFIIPQIPPLPIQRKIVAKLDKIFAEIDKSIAAAEANAKNVDALFQSYLSKIFEHVGEGWKKTKLKDIAEYFNGLTYSPKNISEEGTIVLRSSNIQSDKILLDDIVRVNSTIKEKLYVRNGDILMCSRNGSQRLIGKTATIENLDEKMTFGTFMMIVRSESNFFIEWFFKSNLFKRQIVHGENTMINQITRYILDEIVIPMPDLSTQNSISKNILNLNINTQRLKLSYMRKVNELNSYKKAILIQAFNGELVKVA